MNIAMTIKKLDTRFVLILGLSIALLLPIIYYVLPYGLDFQRDYRPAALVMLRGEYRSFTGFYKPPWTLIPFIPLALLPERLGRFVLFLLGISGFSYILYKVKAKPLPILLFMTSPPVFGCLYNANIDFLPLLALFVPASLGLLFAIIKPQVGIGIVLYHFYTSWKVRGSLGTIRTFFPMGLFIVFSILVYGLPSSHSSNLIAEWFNISLFPYTIIVGLLLLGDGIRRKNPVSAIASSPFFSPYLTSFSLVGPLLALFERPILLALAWILLWVLNLLPLFL
jgi:hypothetical protein